MVKGEQWYLVGHHVLPDPVSEVRDASVDAGVASGRAASSAPAGGSRQVPRAANFAGQWAAGISLQDEIHNEIFQTKFNVFNQLFIYL